MRLPRRLLGTGFVVGAGSHVVTSNHVVQPYAKTSAAKEYLAVFVGVGEEAQPRRASIVAADPDHDVALLEFQGAPGRPLALEPGVAEEGRSVAFTGFPIGAVYGLRPVTHRGIISAVTPIAIPQMSARLLDNRMLRRLRTDFSVYQLDATAYPGNSGSPVYDPQTGRVLAIVSSVFVKQSKENILADPSGITFAIPAGYASELLGRAGLGDP
jgi:S1-C subfamily serine protease